MLLISILVRTIVGNPWPCVGSCDCSYRFNRFSRILDIFRLNISADAVRLPNATASNAFDSFTKCRLRRLLPVVTPVLLDWTLEGVRKDSYMRLALNSLVIMGIFGILVIFGIFASICNGISASDELTVGILSPKCRSSVQMYVKKLSKSMFRTSTSFSLFWFTFLFHKHY